MSRCILLVSNEKELSDIAKEKILSIVKLALENDKEIHIFKEDIQLYLLLKSYENVFYIKGLSSGADLMLFNKTNSNVYYTSDSIKSVKDDHSDIYKMSISRHKTPDRSKSFDETEYTSVRLSLVSKRLRYNISKISDKYTFIVNFRDTKDVNYLNSINPVYGDGKFIYNYDCVKDRVEFSIGGCFLPEINFETCIKEVN